MKDLLPGVPGPPGLEGWVWWSELGPDCGSAGNAKPLDLRACLARHAVQGYGHQGSGLYING